MTKNALVQLDEVRSAIESATDVEEVKELRDRAEALRRYVKSSKAGLQMLNQVAETKLRAERKAGRLLADMDRARPADNLKQVRQQSTTREPAESMPTLADLGLSKIQSHRWQLVAEMPDEVFDLFVEQTYERGEELTSASLLDLAKIYRRREKQGVDPWTIYANEVADGVSSSTSGPAEGSAANDETVFATVIGRNADLMHQVGKLYLRPGDSIADVTYGRGAFWSKLDSTKYQLSASDIVTCPEAAFDFRELPYEDDSFDVAVIDPPYVDFGDRPHSFYEKAYRNQQTLEGGGYQAILDLYHDGMQECVRILQPNGLLMVKCKDFFAGPPVGQARLHIDVFQYASAELGLADVALFILVFPQTIATKRSLNRPRNNQSYLWVFRKPRD